MPAMASARWKEVTIDIGADQASHISPRSVLEQLPNDIGFIEGTPEVGDSMFRKSGRSADLLLKVRSFSCTVDSEARPPKRATGVQLAPPFPQVRTPPTPHPCFLRPL
jgi:hypothetical protein